MTLRLDQVSRAVMLSNARGEMCRQRRFRGSPLWSLVAHVCGVGSRSAVEICKEMGWNPHQNADAPIQEWHEKS